MFVRGFVRKVFAISLSLILAFSLPAFAQLSKESLLKEGLSEEDFTNTITYFYLDPDRDKLVSCLKVILDNESYLSDRVHFLPVAHFFATVAHNDSFFHTELQALRDNYSGIQKEAIEMIIAESDNFYSPNADQSPAALDYLWSEFFATGDDFLIKKIIGVLDYQRATDRQLTDGDVAKALIFGAARWSLTSNAVQHKRVYEIIQAEFKVAQGEKRKNLQQIIEAAEREINQEK